MFLFHRRKKLKGEKQGLDREVLLKVLAVAPKGPRIELGVHTGKSLALIAAHNGPTFGVDSFAGMAVPTEHDINVGAGRPMLLPSCSKFPRKR